MHNLELTPLHRVTQGHTGVYLAGIVAECLQSFDIQNKILGIALDNASNNDTMVSELAELLPGFQGHAARTRCACHVFNLVVKVCA